jgi:hypothetical protein
MTRDTLRIMARNRWPVVQTESGTHGEIVYPYIREIKVVYASGDEILRGYPLERLAVVLADRSGHSFTEVQGNQLRLPTDDEAVVYALPGTDRKNMTAELERLREMEAHA